MPRFSRRSQCGAAGVTKWAVPLEANRGRVAGDPPSPFPPLAVAAGTPVGPDRSRNLGFGPLQVKVTPNRLLSGDIDLSSGAADPSSIFLFHTRPTPCTVWGPDPSVILLDHHPPDRTALSFFAPCPGCFPCAHPKSSRLVLPTSQNSFGFWNPNTTEFIPRGVPSRKKKRATAFLPRWRLSPVARFHRHSPSPRSAVFREGNSRIQSFCPSRVETLSLFAFPDTNRVIAADRGGPRLSFPTRFFAR